MRGPPVRACLRQHEKNSATTGIVQAEPDAESRMLKSFRVYFVRTRGMGTR
jgi:hypothetical protein